MKKLMLVLLVVVILVSGSVTVTAQNTPGITVADVLATFATRDTPEFTWFGRAVSVADPSVLALLQNPNVQLTVFAPTDAAFEKLRETRYGATTLNLLFSNQDLMTNLARYHIVSGAFGMQALETLAEMAPGMGGVSMLTTQGQYLRIDLTGDETLQIDGEASTVVDAVAMTVVVGNESLTIAGRQISTMNGVIHVIDTVLVPTTDTVYQLLNDITNEFEGEFGTLLTAIDRADPSFRQRLSDANANTTLFAPTDAAFEVLGEDALQTALADPQAITDLLWYHTLDGRVSSVNMIDSIAQSRDGRGTYTTKLGGGLFSRTAITISPSGEAAGLLINSGANVLVRDIDAGNGVIHVIDAVLAPPE